MVNSGVVVSTLLLLIVNVIVSSLRVDITDPFLSKDSSTNSYTPGAMLEGGAMSTVVGLPWMKVTQSTTAPDF